MPKGMGNFYAKIITGDDSTRSNRGGRSRTEPAAGKRRPQNAPNSLQMDLLHFATNQRWPAIGVQIDFRLVRLRHLPSGDSLWPLVIQKNNYSKTGSDGFLFGNMLGGGCGCSACCSPPPPPPPPCSSCCPSCGGGGFGGGGLSGLFGGLGKKK
uniref:Uncharacterized protein n=1 Tax=Globodera rostochiensis TaxID=31243 RepID=A0A914IAL9_GLORO